MLRGRTPIRSSTSGAAFAASCFFAEAWIRNAFNTTYIPVAFAYGPLAPSGFIGENGAPRTFGLTAGVKF